MNNRPIIICGAGNSIPFLNSRYNSNHFSHGLEPKLEEIIKGNFSIGLNYFQKYGCETTLTSFADWQFYEDNYNDLKKYPLLVGAYHAQLLKNNVCPKHDNTILLKHGGKYFGKDAWNNTFYYVQNLGTLSLNFAIALGFTEIYLLGFDHSEINGKTHFYQGVCNLKKTTPIYVKDILKCDREHFRGVGKKPSGVYKTGTYNHPNLINKKWFRPFYDDKSVNIYNVSPDSAITLFPKLTYEQFYSKVQNNHAFQDQARGYIRKIIGDNLK